MVDVMCTGLLWDGDDGGGVYWLGGWCVRRLEWRALMRLSYLSQTFNMRRLHAWMEGACDVVGLCLQFGSKVVQIAFTFVLGIKIRH